MPAPASGEAVSAVAPVAENAAPQAPQGLDLSFRPYGYLRLKGSVVEDDATVAFVGRNDGFILQNARVGLAGRLHERIAYDLSVEGAVDERSGANSTEGRLRVGLKDAFVDIDVAPAVTLRLVRFNSVFDLDQNASELDRPFIDRALENRGVFPTQGFQRDGLSPGRSFGVAVRADHAVGGDAFALGYELAVQNGNGEYASVNAGDRPAFSVALMAHLPDAIIVLAGRTDTHVVGDVPFRQTERRYSGALGARASFGRLDLAAQVIGRRANFPSTGGPYENSLGAHGQAGVTFLDFDLGRLVLGYRYGWYEPSDLIVNDTVQEHTAALILRLRNLPLRVQVEGTFARERGVQLDNNRIEALFEVYR